jgi:hypothetical protein
MLHHCRHLLLRAWWSATEERGMSGQTWRRGGFRDGDPMASRPETANHQWVEGEIVPCGQSLTGDDLLSYWSRGSRGGGDRDDLVGGWNPPILPPEGGGFANRWDSRVAGRKRARSTPDPQFVISPRFLTEYFRAPTRRKPGKCNYGISFLKEGKCTSCAAEGRGIGIQANRWIKIVGLAGGPLGVLGGQFPRRLPASLPDH